MWNKLMKGHLLVIATLSLAICIGLMTEQCEALNEDGNNHTIHIPDQGFKDDGDTLVYVESRVSWNNASDICNRSFDGHLLKFNTLEEQENLENFAKHNSLPNGFWIGLQWDYSRTGSRLTPSALIWKDGLCSPKGQVDLFETDKDKEYDPNRQCFMVNGYKDAEWEKESCGVKHPFICQQPISFIVERKNMVFYVIVQASSTMSSCENICRYLDNCFIASPIVDACVVGLASNTPGTAIVKKNNAPQKTTLQDLGVNTRPPDNSEPPPPCNPKATEIKPTKTQLSDHVLLNGSICNVIRESTSPQPTPVAEVSSCTAETMTVNVTVTETSLVTTPSVVETIIYSEKIVTVTPQLLTSTVIVTTTASVTVTTNDPGPSKDQASLSPTPTLSSPSSSTTTEGIDPTTTPETRPLPATDNNLLLKPVNKSQLSKTIRSKTTAPNLKISSIVLGVIISLPVVGVFGFIFISDIRNRLVVHIRTLLLTNIRQRIN